ncbi:hypothetical protein K458DRAFT_440556 [Lentithecium fluviatile CBS 122367]|uniref:Exonuclease V n=1 Tax=Lentithecium fluviatile CBS 122367 TaxID=1168545 RepID=A0A6G1JC86_9PLEO|nr:hypothetical protein K458DRAFT_440556 [Lentithecium fluviatile CBS 122367]
MDDTTVSAIVRDAQSDYGSEIDVLSNHAPSDYGSDFDANDLDLDEDKNTRVGELLDQIAATAPRAAVYPSTEIQETLEGGNHECMGVVVDTAERQRLRPALRWAHSSPARRRSVSVELEYDVCSRRAFSVPQEDAPKAPLPVVDESCSPLERFRTKPRKPLSVTDLVSPAWCELQYFYTLSRFGRKPRTRAMKQGSKIHQALEDQVHTVVPVRVESKEDRFGLRLWNAIQGLRCLRETGLTRELEVWSVIEGQVVNGVIDELSFKCPDPDLKEQHELSKVEKCGGTLPLGEFSIQKAFAKAGAAVGETEDKHAWIGALEPDRQVYIADVKTRGVRSLPRGASLRPTWMQLMLYRKLLESLSLNSVDAETVFARYNVAPLQTFSEPFMLEVGAMDINDMQIDSDVAGTTLQTNELRSHPNLLSLWSLMVSEYQRTVPSISDILRAEFRYSKTGDIIGSELIVYNIDIIDAYIKDEMEWWRGVREAKGVEIEEAFKCRVCDFADDCGWRKTKIEEATEKHRLRRGKREKSDV